MAERYSKLFSLTKDLYTEGSPIVIAAGALLFDNKTSQVLAQLKVRNIGSKAIKAVTVKITPLDTAGRPLGEAVMSQYLDLVLNRDQEFGQKLPIKLPNNATRSFNASVAEVVFIDNEIWTCSHDDWESLPAAKSLESWLTERELLKQYKMRYGQDCSYVSERIEDLWYCACGAINRNDEETCHICKKSLTTLLSVDIDQLTEEKDARLKKEAEAEAARLKKKAEEEAARQKREAEEKAAAEAKAAENRAKARKITIIVLTSLAVTMGVILLFAKVIIPNNNYKKAKTLLSEGRFEEATAVFETLGDYKDSTDLILECQYQKAMTLAESGQHQEAVELFEALNDYKDSNMKASDLRVKLIIEKLKTASIGDYVVFGSYEQDNNAKNGQEQIEWLVLAKEDNRILVISRYALACQKYNLYDENVTWGTCSLRAWMNETFINDAFNLDEQVLLQNTMVTADKNYKYQTFSGKDTTDKVFLLSIIEMNKYFISDKARQCQGTDYCLAQGVFETGNGNCLWWLRSPGYNANCAANVAADGSVRSAGFNVTYNQCAVRPAMWINLDP